MPKKKIDKKDKEKKAQKPLKLEDPNAGQIEDQSITEEMKKAYLEYAMSVIVSRALPDVRDGLKPVHRRILYAMWRLGLKANAKFRKSATVVGEVLGKYHPHGDTAVYDSMVRMAQDFSLRYPLVRGQGNFGSMDGDGAAAMRYTEAKLQSISEEMLFDIDRDTIDFMPNYDGSQKEPKVMPSKLPQLLLNGTMGIAVGMATNIPPHNLSELIAGINHLIDNPKCEIEDLVKFIPAPDFPTGGIIYDIKEIQQAYITGKGKVLMRGKTEIVETNNGRFKILVTEIPYQVNKATLLEKIALLVKDKKLDGIKDIRDESDRHGVRICIELKRDAFPKKVLNRLFKLTQLQTNFHVNMLALVDGIQPKVLNLKDVLEYYLQHRQEVVRRRTAFDLRKAEERAHILEGLKKAIDNIDAVIKLIKKSKDREEAKSGLMKKFKLSERQSVAILEMRLQNLANLERLRIEKELKEKQDLIKNLKSILASAKKILNIIKEELKEINDKYGDERKTRIIKGPVGQFSQEDLVPNEPTIVMLTRDGYIKRIPPNTFKTQKRGGKGVIGLTTKEEDVVQNLLTTMAHNDLLLFTTGGKVFQLKAYDIPESSRTAKGQAIVNFLQLAPSEKVSTILPVDAVEKHKYLFMGTEKGLVKKVELSQFAKVRRSGLIAIKLNSDDKLIKVEPTTGKDQVMLVSSRGQSIRFNEKNVRAMGRAAAGVRGIRLKSNDFVVSMNAIDSEEADKFQLLTIAGNGYGKRSILKHYKVQNRGGSGIRCMKITVKTGNLVFAEVLNKEASEVKDLLAISKKGQVIRLPFKSISVLGRDTQGVRIMRFKNSEDTLIRVTTVGGEVEDAVKKDEEDEGEKIKKGKKS